MSNIIVQRQLMGEENYSNTFQRSLIADKKKKKYFLSTSQSESSAIFLMSVRSGRVINRANGRIILTKGKSIQKSISRRDDLP